MSVRKAKAHWEGTLKEGQGTMELPSMKFVGPFTWASRFAEGQGTNPEELVGAAQAGCYSMFLSSLLTKAGTPPKKISTTATVHLEAGPKITLIELHTEAHVPGIAESKFQELAKEAHEKCPVAVALSAVPNKLHARLVS